MTFDQNDPKWTAYAFDELDGDQRAAIEAELRANADGERFVNELRQTGELLKSARSSEPTAALTADQRGELVGGGPSRAGNAQPGVTLPPSPPRVRNRRRWIAALGAIAASVVVGAVLLPPIKLQSRKVATKSTETKADKTTSLHGVDSNIAFNRGELANAATTAELDQTVRPWVNSY